MNPPRIFFENEAHYAAQLALLDGAGWVQAARIAPDVHGRVFYAEFAISSLRRVHGYLKKGRIGEIRTRREYSAATLAHRALALEAQAQELLTREAPPPLCSEVEFALIVPAPGGEVIYV